MNTPNITKTQIMAPLPKLKNNKSPGPNNYKTEFYKALLTKAQTIKTITRCFNNILTKREIPKDWKKKHHTQK